MPACVITAPPDEELPLPEDDELLEEELPVAAATVESLDGDPDELDADDPAEAPEVDTGSSDGVSGEPDRATAGAALTNAT
jgi:hypothetical protein